jgi:hypothetical protein
MRDMGQKTREEALSGLSEAERQRLLETLSRMKSNLLEACALPVAERELKHG